MISKALKAIENGFNVMRFNSRLLLVGVLVFVFPILFLWTTQSFIKTANTNIETSEKRFVSLMQDSLASIYRTTNKPDNIVASLIDSYKKENLSVSRIVIIEKEDDKYKVVQSSNHELIGSYYERPELEKTVRVAVADSSSIFNFFVDGERYWQVYRLIETTDGRLLYLISEHNFSQIDSLMLSRQQDSYRILTAIFVFLIALAYWLNKQMYWKKLYDKSVVMLEERDMFSNMIAHEFRSPLTAIKGYASFLEESKDMSQDEIRFASNIRKSAERLVSLVSDFLEVARIQSGKMKIEKTEVDMREIISSVTDDLRIMAQDKGLELIFDKPLKPILMQTDPARMTQVMTNIITNAIKYTHQGKVVLDCTKIPGEVVVKVKDTGAGINAEDQQKLFSPFTRVGGADSSGETGTGLGMWITKQLVALLGGTIGIESIEGVGTHVVINFRVHV